MSSLVYEGRDLEAMAFAKNYHRWILGFFHPLMGRRVVEVGAGSGLFSELILEHDFDSVSLVEPSTDMCRILSDRVARTENPAEVKTYNALFGDVAAEIKEDQPDSIIYVNVMEHIPDDEAEMRAAHGVLDAGGRIFVFVPALPRLYGRFDERIGHFRRYTKPELEEKCRRAGFKVVESRYFDLLGIAPWWIKYRLLRSDTLEPKAVEFYDRYLFPVEKGIERLIAPPIGKNVILVAEKT